MNDDPPSSQPPAPQPNTSERSWLDRMLNAFSNEPKSREELLRIITEAAGNKLLDKESLEIIRGAFDVQDRHVRDILIPRSRMVVININESLDEILQKIIESAHSRFPVVGESNDDIRGILLAKELLPLILNGKETFDIESIIRPATIIPESKRLNVLLREFRENRYHMAVVIDEYGGVSGLVTIEDILEEIVGDIEDETDEDETSGLIRKAGGSDFLVKAQTPIECFNEYFDTTFNEDDFDTIGGIVMQAFGHLPKMQEHIDIDGFRFNILFADDRKIHVLKVTPPEG